MKSFSSAVTFLKSGANLENGVVGGARINYGRDSV